MKVPRSSGVILHVSSLYTPHGIGDFGPSAYEFVNQLASTGIFFWQTLPLNYTDAARAYSPYSCLSSMAGNPLYISPDLLVNDNLLEGSDLETLPFKENIVDYDKVYPYKTLLFERAFKNFQLKDQSDFRLFCKQHKSWLNDFSLFIALKKHYNDSWWIDWPRDIKNRKRSSLKEMTILLEEEIYKEKFLQYLFFKQLKELRHYCKSKNVSLIGDMPFYVGHDSCDVWTRPEYFKLDKSKKPAKVCGVPPDLFSENGQLWGMPTFQWSEMKKDNYKWWVDRVRQTLYTCDIVRLDHFRAFSAYWEVDAKEVAAKNGKWKKGPGKVLFKVLKRHFPDMPFIAEDLGQIDQPVWDIMDKFHLPGMKILQFAFTEYTPESIHSPHHHVPHGVVYTGTHDNNTTRGWFENEMNEKQKEDLSFYLNKEAKAETIAKDMIRLAIESVSQVAIWPIQDLLNLGEEAIMNRPGTMNGNWLWRLNGENVISEKTGRELTEQLIRYNRIVAQDFE